MKVTIQVKNLPPREPKPDMKRYTLVGLLALSILAGCSSTKKVVPDIPPAQLYSQAQASMQNGEWQKSIERLEALDSRYPFGAYSKQVQLDLIYTYYKNADYALSLATIERFKRFNPTSPNMDWVLYMSGLNYMAQDANFVQELFKIDRSDRDPSSARSAFMSFKQLLNRYPHSIYANDTHLRMIALKNKLANYDLAIADYYLRRGAWIAAIDRTQEIQQKYANTEAARRSLIIAKKAFEALKLDKSIQRTEALMTLNPVNRNK